MNIKHYTVLVGATFLSLSLGTAQAADQAPARPTEVQMQAVHDCATAKGVELPTPPAGGPPPQGERHADGQKPPRDGKGPHGPKLTEAQRAVVDACFTELGIERPKGPPHGGKRGLGAPPTPPKE